MRRYFPMLGLVALVASSLGCTMCTTAHMYDYAGAGGKWQRGNPTCGRVGSILSDAGATQSDVAAGYVPQYGDSWGLIEGEPVPAVDVDGGTTIDGGFIEGGYFEESGSAAMPAPGSIMIGP